MKCGLKETEKAELLLQHTSAAAVSHFELCSSCREASLRHVALWKDLDAWSVPDVSSGFNRTLYNKIDAASAQSWYERLAAVIRPAFAQPSIALGVAGVVVAAGFVLDHKSTAVFTATSTRSHVAFQGAPAIPVSRVEAEQLEKTLDDLEMLRQFDPVSEEKENASKSM